MRERNKPIILIWTIGSMVAIFLLLHPKFVRDLKFEGVRLSEEADTDRRYMKEASAIVASWNKDDDEGVNSANEGDTEDDYDDLEADTVTTEAPETEPEDFTLDIDESILLPAKVCDRRTRLELLQETCDEFGLTDEPINWKRLAGYQWIVDHVHKLFYCMIPKTATHSMRYLLAADVVDELQDDQLYPIHNYLNVTGFRFLHKVPEEEREMVLNTYFKMMIVRHPMDRLRSAYGNKMKDAGGLNEQVLRRNIPIIEDYLRDKGKLEPETPFDPLRRALSLEEFLDLTSIEPDFIDEHWRSAFTTCRPCTIKYDAIMRVETLEQDMMLLTDHIKSQGFGGANVQHQNVEKDTRPAQKLASATETFASVKSRITQGVLKTYENDFKMFGYRWNSTHGAMCEMYDSSGERCC